MLDEDILESLAEAFTKRILNIEGEFILKAPRSSPFVLRYPYDHGPDVLDDFKRRRTIDAKAEDKAPGTIYRPGVETKVEA